MKVEKEKKERTNKLILSENDTKYQRRLSGKCTLTHPQTHTHPHTHTGATVRQLPASLQFVTSVLVENFG